MRLPSKVTSYKDSTFVKFPVILGYLKDGDMRPDDLFKKVKAKNFSVVDYMEVLDCLYMLGKIEMKPGKEVLHYVG